MLCVIVLDRAIVVNLSIDFSLSSVVPLPISADVNHIHLDFV